jgi:cytochrome c-type biogenesis protein CcmH/NrfG
VSIRRAALALGALVAVYLALVGWRGVLLVGEGAPATVVLGLAVIALPLVGAWAVWREIRFGLESEQMARQLEAEGGLPVDDLPRRPSGRPDRAAADAAFVQRREAAQAAPDDWRSWFRLALAYDDAGDRRRARQTMRRAGRLHRTAGAGQGQVPG